MDLSPPPKIFNFTFTNGSFSITIIKDMKTRLLNFLSDEFYNIFNPAFFGLTIMILSLRLVKVFEAVQSNLPFKDLLLIIVLLLPSISLVILPIAYLIAVTITLTKLSNSYELIALNNSGISALRIMKLMALISLPILFFNIINSMFIKPHCNKVLREMLTSNIENIIPIPQKSIFTRLSKGRYIYVDENIDRLKSIIFADFQEDSFTIVSANEGEMDKGFINFNNGNLVSKREEKIEILSFESLSFPIIQGIERKSDVIRRGSIPFFDIINLYKSGIEKTIIKTEIYYRIFYPLAPIILLILSFPLSIGFSRHYKTQGIIISIGIGLLFYVSFSFIDTLSLKGKIEPLLGFIAVYGFLLIISLLIYFKKGFITKRL